VDTRSGAPWLPKHEATILTTVSMSFQMASFRSVMVESTLLGHIWSHLRTSRDRESSEEGR
jgi:hypothetical protein